MQKMSQRVKKNQFFDCVVVGDSSVSVFYLADHLRKFPESNCLWLTSSGAKLAPTLPFFESEKCPDFFRTLAQAYDCDLGPIETGDYLREFRNKSWRVPNWAFDNSVTEDLWLGERVFALQSQARFVRGSLYELEEQLRLRLVDKVEKREADLVQEIEQVDDEVNLTLASGEQLKAREVIFCDKYTVVQSVALKAHDILVKGHSLGRGRHAFGVLQAVFNHTDEPASAETSQQNSSIQIQEGLCCVINRDSGEEFDRRVWGHFFAGGKKSIWTISLTSEECEDNHLIAKKFRRMKQALEKMFPEKRFAKNSNAAHGGQSENDERVQFHENILFGVSSTQSHVSGSAHMTQAVKLASHCYWVNDGYGFKAMVEQLESIDKTRLGLKQVLTQQGSEAEAVSVEVSCS